MAIDDEMIIWRHRVDAGVGVQNLIADFRQIDSAEVSESADIFIRYLPLDRIGGCLLYNLTLPTTPYV